MKKAFVVLFVAGAMAAGLTSCKGDYTCTCTYDYISGQDTSITVAYNGFKKSDAEDGCEMSETNLKNIDANASCTLE